MEIKLNKETIGLVLGVAGLVGTCWTGFQWIQSGRPEHSPIVQEIKTDIKELETRADRTDRDRERFNGNIKELGDKTVDLRIAVEKLTTTIELQSVEKKRAEAVEPAAPSYTSPLLPLRTERRK